MNDASITTITITMPSVLTAILVTAILIQVVTSAITLYYGVIKGKTK